MYGKELTNVEEMLVIAKEMERVLGELDETLFEPLKEQHEGGMITNVALGKQITTPNDFLKGVSSRVGKFSFRTNNSNVCQICKSTDHIAIMCPHIGDLKPKCAKCGLPHNMEFCKMRCGYCYGMGHIEERC
jgi:hypothetical protein